MIKANYTVKHLLIIAVIGCLGSLFSLLPYFAKKYDTYSVMVSMYIQVVCFLLLILVPAKFKQC